MVLFHFSKIERKWCIPAQKKKITQVEEETKKKKKVALSLMES